LSLAGQVRLLIGEADNIVQREGNVIPSRADHVKGLGVRHAPAPGTRKLVCHLLNGRWKSRILVQVSDIAVGCHGGVHCSGDRIVGAVRLVGW
jgi:hypothetical protein